MNIERDRKCSPFSLLSDSSQRSSGLIRHYCVHQRAHTRVRSCKIQAQCPSNQPSSLPCKSPVLFSGSTTCLNILLIVRLPVYRAARALHRTWDMNTHSPLSVYHLLYSILIPQHSVPLASMRPNRSHQHPQHPRASPVAPFSPHLKDCPLYSRKLFYFSNFFVDPWLTDVRIFQLNLPYLEKTCYYPWCSLPFTQVMS
jgi:hypothetical protein